MKFLKKIFLATAIFISCFSCFISLAAEQNGTSDIGEEEEGEITCDTLIAAFQEYDETITASEQAFIRVLINLSNFFQKTPKEIAASAESMKQGISEALRQVQGNSTTLGDRGFDIQDTMEDCLARLFAAERQLEEIKNRLKNTTGQ